MPAVKRTLEALRLPCAIGASAAAFSPDEDLGGDVEARRPIQGALAVLYGACTFAFL